MRVRFIFISKSNRSSISWEIKFNHKQKSIGRIWVLPEANPSHSPTPTFTAYFLPSICPPPTTTGTPPSSLNWRYLPFFYRNSPSPSPFPVRSTSHQPSTPCVNSWISKNTSTKNHCWNMNKMNSFFSIRNATTIKIQLIWPRKPQEFVNKNITPLWKIYGTGVMRRKLSAPSMTTTASSTEYWYSIDCEIQHQTSVQKCITPFMSYDTGRPPTWSTFMVLTCSCSFGAFPYKDSRFSMPLVILATSPTFDVKPVFSLPYKKWSKT